VALHLLLVGVVFHGFDFLSSPFPSSVSSVLVFLRVFSSARCSLVKLMDDGTAEGDMYL
jgi:hypothetical protein